MVFTEHIFNLSYDSLEIIKSLCKHANVLIYQLNALLVFIKHLQKAEIPW